VYHKLGQCNSSYDNACCIQTVHLPGNAPPPLPPTPTTNLLLLPCSLFLGNIELPSPGSKQTIKMPIGTYEFGANLVSEKVREAGRDPWQEGFSG
jgi:hypothetical protein